jgi:hypothetical protein
MLIAIARNPHASRDKSKCTNQKPIKTHRSASHPYVPLPVFVGGKWSLAVESVPQFATFCHQKSHWCHLPSKMPQSATICRILHFSANVPLVLLSQRFQERAVAPILAEKYAPRCLRHFLEVEHYSTLRGESW